MRHENRLPSSGQRRSPVVAVLLIVAAIGAMAALLVSPAHSAATKVIHVDDDAALGGNGSSRSPYNNIPDALAAANATSAAVVIVVAPGSYAVGSTLVIDRPLELRGSSVLIEDADGWPTGETAAGTETRVFSNNSTLSELIRIGRGDGRVLSDVSIRGFVLHGTAQRDTVSLARVQGFWLDANIFRAPARLGVQSTASSGRVTGNYFRGVGTGASLNGGYAESLSDVVVTGNRSVQNNLGGVVLVGSSMAIPEVGDRLNAVVRDNDLSANAGLNQGFGLRVAVMSPEPGVAQSAGSVYARVQDNRIAGNRIGLQVDAGFPYRSVSGVCDSRVYSGAIDLDLAGNTLTGSLQAPALVTFTRNTAAVNPSMLALWQYLHVATYTISDNDGTLVSAWIDHPATDPFIGTCPGDASNEPLENALVYNGVALPNGRNF